MSLTSILRYCKVCPWVVYDFKMMSVITVTVIFTWIFQLLWTWFCTLSVCVNHIYSMLYMNVIQYIPRNMHTVFALLCFFCGYILTDFLISIKLNSLALWQSNDCPSASKATLMNMDEYFMWIHYERLHNLNKAKHNKTVCIFLGIYCICGVPSTI